jgi:peptidoglycan/xylan/chitin deacetylase (PgdA/CDA1 family)
MKWSVYIGLVCLAAGFAIVLAYPEKHPVAVPSIPPFASPSVSPSPSASASFVSEIDNGPRDKKVIALTFDADMTPHMVERLKNKEIPSLYNKEVIEVLRDSKVPATLFLTGLWAEQYPAAAADLASDPLFEIGNHSYNHYGFMAGCFGLPTLAEAQAKENIEAAQSAITKAAGITPRFFRFPGGCHSPAEVQTTNSLGLTVVGWDVSSTDAFNKNTETIVKHVEAAVENGSIIVFHLHGADYAPKTAEALRQIIPYFQQKGFAFVKVSQLMADTQ